MLEGQNTIVLDLETLHSAEDCRLCGATKKRHAMDFQGEYHQYRPFGWDNPPALGLSIGAYWDHSDSRLHWFDRMTLEATVQLFVTRQPLLVSFNGIGFDFPLMRGLLRQQADGDANQALVSICDAFEMLYTTSYDILAEIWKADPARKFERGLNSLGVISEANGFGQKEMDGAMAPRLWTQRRYAEVIAYNVGDVLKTKGLFEQICTQGTILRGDGQPIELPHPPVSV